MFSSSVRRAALATPPVPISPSLAGSIPRAATSQTLSSRCHQRRASSSKPSSPANGSKKISEDDAVTAASAKSAASKTTNDGTTAAVGPPSQGERPRGGKRKAKSVAAKATVKGRDESILHLPSVPSTQHVTPLQLGASAFFSLYRPMSLTNGFPKSVTEDSFAAIFTSRVKVNKPSEVISTLSNTLKRLDAVTGKMETVKIGQQNQWEEADDIRAAITADSYRNAETQHLDAAPEESALNVPQQLMSGRYQPFNPPPAPMPLNTAEALAAGVEAAESLEPSYRTYTTVLTIEESMNSNGDVTYTAHHSPIVAEDPPATPKKFLERMHIRQEQYRINRKEETDMLAISVKRQRKLKMKKHKYKKLMRRTRNLRRRLDRN